MPLCRKTIHRRRRSWCCGRVVGGLPVDGGGELGQRDLSLLDHAREGRAGVGRHHGVRSRSAETSADDTNGRGHHCGMGQAWTTPVQGLYASPHDGKEWPAGCWGAAVLVLLRFRPSDCLCFFLRSEPDLDGENVAGAEVVDDACLYLPPVVDEEPAATRAVAASIL
jgi:hypothetical protein